MKRAMRMRRMRVPGIACQSKLWKMCCLARAWLAGRTSSLVTKRTGMTKPMATPRGWQAAPIVTAITLYTS